MGLRITLTAARGFRLPPGRVWVLKKTYKGKDGTQWRKGSFVVEFCGYAYGMVPSGCIPVVRLKCSDKKRGVWVVGSKSFECVEQIALKLIR
mmetsp:Transcript_579/g.982  ORF Transcript_579/g.982 Transcript_579/m.982 type:complete len:92 (+) Transcript_579:152-427(+)